VFDPRDAAGAALGVDDAKGEAVKGVFSLIVLALLSACSALPPVDEHTGAYDRQVSTGSNIPHKSSDAQSIGREGLDNVTRFGPNGACTKPLGGGCS
jgi:hypothetical protein